MRVLLTVEAEDELSGAAMFYAAEASPSLGNAFIDEVDRACQLLQAQPLIGGTWRGATRRLALRRFPFNLVYCIRDGDVVVIAIAHQRRRPGYWIR